VAIYRAKPDDQRDHDLHAIKAMIAAVTVATLVFLMQRRIGERLIAAEQIDQSRATVPLPK
jgi:hypothetical protein